jgi:hypothetical protein
MPVTVTQSKEDTMTKPYSGRIAAAAVCIAAGLLVAGCGSSSPAPDDAAPVADTTTNTTGTPPSADPTDTVATPDATSSVAATGDTTACNLVTEQDVTTALGADPGPARKFEQGGATQCQYGSYQTKFVLVNVTPTRGVAAYELVHSNPNLHSVDVAGVGDKAFEVSGPSTAGIYFTKGDALVVVTVTIRSASSASDQTLALAKVAASRV